MNAVMNVIRCLLIAVLCGLALSGCETPGITSMNVSKAEQAMKSFNFEGLRLGDKPSSLQRFPQVQKQPFGRSQYDIYEIYNPNDQISIAIAYFSGDRLVKLELRYFDGPGIRTLSRAGGWAGLRDYLCTKFGPPSRAGNNVALVTEFYGLKPEYAKFNGEWIFSRLNRRVNYVAFTDDKGGIGLVTFTEIAPPAPAPTPAPKPKPAPVSYPIVERKSEPAATVVRSAPFPTPPPAATPALLPVPPLPANPGF